MSQGKDVKICPKQAVWMFVQDWPPKQIQPKNRQFHAKLSLRKPQNFITGSAGTSVFSIREGLYKFDPHGRCSRKKLKKNYTSSVSM